jgi:uncharacterized protein (DUF169 family)
MSSSQQDFAIFDRFNFERKPVAVKYLYWKPEGIEQLDKNIAFCETLTEAQKGSPFYAVKENITCGGPTVLGMEGTPPIVESGELGVALEGFKDTRAARRVYPSLPVMPRNTVNYVAFSTLDKLSFEPDILIITASVSQAEVLLRAMSYATGKIWSSKKTLFVACAWLFIYPYITGELNYTVTGLSAGMKAKELFPEGLILMSIPKDLLPTMIQSLQEMKWVLPAWAHGKEEFEKYFANILRELSKQP